MYSLKEILDLAVQMEQAGIEFYTECGARFSGEIYQEIFHFLADQEKNHKKKFEELQENIFKNKSESSEDYFRYMKSLGGDRIFKKPGIGEMQKIIKTPHDALLKGIEDEKNSIFYYTEIKNAYSSGSDESLILDEIISEERTHIMKLDLVLTKITAL